MPSKKKASASAPEPEWIEPRLSEEELRTIAIGITNNTIFTSAHMRGKDVTNDMHLVFMPLMFSSQAQLEAWAAHPPAMIYAEYKDQFGSRSINGYPMFSKCSLLYKQDAQIVSEKVQAIRKAMEAI